ncbi:chromosome segregation protein SMC [Candidatus Bathyarchaeota archaeon]|nr:chromosome segregation protein SMC [Candidatus Bathyarchaeota archaeon]
MVYIKRIDVKGFKTFTKKVSLKLEKGLTVITGPNGSGKSNIVDAIKFALGELSPKEMRGSSLEDLISKSISEQESNLAYVAIQFDNSDRRIPIDSDLVTISREFSKGGEGVYRINGKRISRKQLTDLLSSASIQVNSFNIIPQHAITKLAEIAPEERRKIIEEMIGIAVYDARKTEAEEQLQKAEVNIKIASARMDEVKARLEALGRERNNLLKNQLLKKEISLLEAEIISSEWSKLNKEIKAIELEVEKEKEKLSVVEKEKNDLARLKLTIEEESRKEREALEKKNLDLLNLEKAVGGLNAQIAKLKAELQAKINELTSLGEQEKNIKQKLAEASESKLKLSKDVEDYSSQKECLKKIIQEKTVEKEKLESELNQIKKEFSSFIKEKDALNQRLNEFLQAKIKVESEIKACLEKLELMKTQLTSFEARRSNLADSISKSNSYIESLIKIKAEKEKALIELNEKLNESQKLVLKKRRELQNALETLKKARTFILEFETEKSTLQKAFPDKLALSELEAMVEAGALKGVYGKLRSLIEFNEIYRKAVEASSSGWLDALVVEDEKTAALCLTILKEAKLGRVKILPLKLLQKNLSEETVKEFKPLKSVIKYPVEIEAAVNYVFGDTFITDENELNSSLNVRLVNLNGDLIEAEGAVEGGYYRKPINIEAVTKKIKGVKNLEKTLESLDKIVDQRKIEIENFENEIDKLKHEKAKLESQLAFLSSDKTKIEAALTQDFKELTNLEEKAQQLKSKIEFEKNVLNNLLLEKKNLELKIQSLIEEKEKLEKIIEAFKISEKEVEIAKVNEELNNLQKNLSIVESKLSIIQEKLKILNEEEKQNLAQFEELKKKIESGKIELNNLQFNLNKIEGNLALLEEEKTGLTLTISSLKAKLEEFEVKLKNISEKLIQAQESLYAVNLSINDFSSKIREKQTKISFLTKELNKLGYMQPLEPRENIEEAKETVKVLRRELEEIGAVNELAETHYKEYKDNYKQLSIRINELEEERNAIISFIKEIDEEKLEAFTKAFNKVNCNFQEIFSKISNGGFGRLILENPEDPFRGGVDMLLNFPGKAELSVNSASGGEKSVATICFILALQSIKPMPFYLFDEVDAHLDALNSSKLAELLKEKSVGAQFIVISLKDVTISKAHNVYGIFVQKGSSQIVSLPIQEVKK